MVLYLDSLLIFSKTFDDHLKHLDLVLSKLEEYDLTLSPQKCSFATKSAQFLGHEISKTGVQPSNDIVRSFRLMSRPLNVSSLKRCLKLFTFCHAFIPNRGELMSPLLRLLRKGIEWHWTDHCAQNFEKLKKIMSSQIMLHHPYFSKQYYCVTDSTNCAISGVLLQVCDKTGKFVPIAFASRATSVAEQKRPQMELEVLAVVFCITNFDQYLTGKHFKLYTDNTAVKDLLLNKQTSPKLKRWSLFLTGYSFSIDYIKTSDNKVSDFLSRYPRDYTRTDSDENTDEFPCIPHIPGFDLLTTVYDTYHPV